MALTLDTRQFSKALVQYQAATGKDCVEVLNRAGRNVAYRAAQNTPRAARIRADLEKSPRLKYALTSIALKKRGIGVLQSPEFRQAVSRFVNRRVSSAGFLRSGWAESVEALGGSFRGRRIGKGHGWASKATVNKLLTEIANTVPGIEQVGTRALQAALAFVAQDMIDYANGLLAKTARKHSA